MNWIEINPLIQEKLKHDIKDDNVREFILDVLTVEQNYDRPRGILSEYKRKLEKHIPEEI